MIEKNGLTDVIAIDDILAALRKKWGYILIIAVTFGAAGLVHQRLAREVKIYEAEAYISIGYFSGKVLEKPSTTKIIMNVTENWVKLAKVIGLKPTQNNLNVLAAKVSLVAEESDVLRIGARASSQEEALLIVTYLSETILSNHSVLFENALKKREEMLLLLIQMHKTSISSISLYQVGELIPSKTEMLVKPYVSDTPVKVISKKNSGYVAFGLGLLLSSAYFMITAKKRSDSSGGERG
ncbi:MAG: hypothetical protein CVU77_01720 [Elusimicrobia bacterium HGW-Elusimicrobia-1]|jgi:hypothetical protein|nr:MAG: hypothetical protein CVU77_01720 [Elusimicrobia bacterium HGW-Elusimicrobia-1]